MFILMNKMLSNDHEGKEKKGQGFALSFDELWYRKTQCQGCKSSPAGSFLI